MCLSERQKEIVQFSFDSIGAEQARVHSLDDCGKILDIFVRFGHKEIDTARSYAGGTSEQYLGDLDWQLRGLVMETKLGPGVHKHNAEGLRLGLTQSLEALKSKSVCTHSLMQFAPIET